MNDPRHDLQRQGARLAEELEAHVRPSFPDPESGGLVLTGAYERLRSSTAALRAPTHPFDEFEDDYPVGRTDVDMDAESNAASQN